MQNRNFSKKSSQNLLEDRRSSGILNYDEFRQNLIFHNQTKNKNNPIKSFINESFFLNYLMEKKNVETWIIRDDRHPSSQYYLHWTSGGIERYENLLELNRVLSQECDGSWQVTYLNGHDNLTHFILDESSWIKQKYTQFYSVDNFYQAYHLKNKTFSFTNTCWNWGIKLLAFTSLNALYNNFTSSLNHRLAKSLALFPLASAEAIENQHYENTFLLDPPTGGLQAYADMTLLPQGYLIGWSVDDGITGWKVFNTIYDHNYQIINDSFQIEKSKKIFTSKVSCCYMDGKYYIQTFGANPNFFSYIQINEVINAQQVGDLIPLPFSNQNLIYSHAKINNEEMVLSWTNNVNLPSGSFVNYAKAKFLNGTLQFSSSQRLSPTNLRATLAYVSVIDNTGDYRFTYYSAYNDGTTRPQIRANFFYYNGSQARSDFRIYVNPTNPQYYSSIASSKEGVTLITFSVTGTASDPNANPQITWGQFYDFKGNNLGGLFTFQNTNAYFKHLSDYTMHVKDDTFLTLWFTHIGNQRIGTYYGRFTRASQNGFFIGNQFAIAPTATFAQTFDRYLIKQIISTLSQDGCYYTVLYATENLAKGRNFSYQGKKFSSKICLFNLPTFTGYKGQQLPFNKMSMDAPDYIYSSNNNITMTFTTNPNTLGNIIMTEFIPELVFQGNNTNNFQVNGNLVNLNRMFRSLGLSLNNALNLNGTVNIFANDQLMFPYEAKTTVDIVSLVPKLIQQEPITIVDGTSGTVLITSNKIKATIAGNEEIFLNFYVVPPIEFCNFYYTADSNQSPITSFSQQEIKDSQISFKYLPGMQSEPQYFIKACNGDITSNNDCTEPTRGWLRSYYENPLVIKNNFITITQGKVIILADNNLNSTNRINPDKDAEIQYEVRNVKYCWFKFINDTPGEGLRFFSQADISNEYIKFGDQRLLPEFEIRAMDATYQTPWMKPSISYLIDNNNDDIPTDNSWLGLLNKYWTYLATGGSAFLTGIVPAVYQCIKNKQEIKKIQSNPLLYAIETELEKKGRTLGTNFNDKKARELKTFFSNTYKIIHKVISAAGIHEFYNDEEFAKSFVNYCTNQNNIDKIFYKKYCSFFASYILSYEKLDNHQRELIFNLTMLKLSKKENVDTKAIESKIDRMVSICETGDFSGDDVYSEEMPLLKNKSR